MPRLLPGLSQSPAATLHSVAVLRKQHSHRLGAQLSELPGSYED